MDFDFDDFGDDGPGSFGIRRSPRVPSSSPDFETRDMVRDLEDRVGRLSLALQTIISMSIERGHFSGEEFRAIMQKIDAADGVVDGKYNDSKNLRTCPSCQRNNQSRHRKCQYCGTELE